MIICRLVCSLLFAALATGFVPALADNPKDSQLSESESPHDSLKKAISAASKVTSYRLRIDSSRGGVEATTIFEFAAPDRAHLTGKNGEIISIGEDMYRKRGNSGWLKNVPGGPGQMDTDLPARRVLDALSTMRDSGAVMVTGRKTIDGTPTLAYQHRFGGSPGTTSIEKLWVGIEDGLPRQAQMEYPFESGTVIVRSTYYDYNADIRIDAPAEYTDAIPQPGSTSGVKSGSAPAAPGRTLLPVTRVSQKPIPLNSPMPRYTEEARQQDIQGVVIARVLVGANGTPRQVRIVRGLPYGLDEQAIQAVYQLRFCPAFSDGQPIAFWQSVQIEFKLRDKK